MFRTASRRALAFAMASIVLLTFSLTSEPSARADAQPRKILTGWIPYYGMKSALPAAVTNGDLIQEVMPFWYSLKSATSIADLYKPANPSVPISIPLTTMRDSGFTIIPTITDGTAKLVLSGLIAKAKTRTQVVATITKLVMDNNFDGIDLDFEGFAFVDGISTWSATRPNWVLFVQELSASLHAQNKLLSITTPVLFDPTTGKKGYYLFDWAAISPMIDRLRIMTYDYSTGSQGPIGPIAWVDESVKYAVSVIAASKIYIGVPGYGRDWVTKVEGVCPSQYSKAIAVGAKPAVFVQRDAITLAANYRTVPTFNATYSEATFSYKKVYEGVSAAGLATKCTATRRAWYQNAQSYTDRANLVAKYRLGGITLWTLGMQDTDAIQAVRTVATGIAPAPILNSLTLDKSEMFYGESLNLTGLFQLTDKQPVVGLGIKIEVKPVGEDAWKKLEIDPVTGSDGTISLPLILGHSTQIRLTSEGSWERLASTSSELPVNVKRRLAITAPATASIGNGATISGVIQPHEAGANVQLERLVKGVWKSEGAAEISDPNGHFVLSYLGKSRSIVTFRIRVSPDAKFDEVISPIFNIVIS